MVGKAFRSKGGMGKRQLPYRLSLESEVTASRLRGQLCNTHVHGRERKIAEKLNLWRRESCGGSQHPE